MKSLTFLALTLHIVGCSKPERPKPDGSCGIRGRCLLPADKDAGDAAERKPWAGVQVTAHENNSPYGDYDNRFRATTDAKGEFMLPLTLGEYTVGVHDPKLLKNKMHSPVTVKVEAGKFTEMTLDYDKMNVRDLQK